MTPQLNFSFYNLRHQSTYFNFELTSGDDLADTLAVLIRREDFSSENLDFLKNTFLNFSPELKKVRHRQT